MKKRVKEHIIILYDFFVENLGGKIALVIVFPIVILSLGIIGYGIMLMFGIFGLEDSKWIIGIGLILFVIIFSPNDK